MFIKFHFILSSVNNDSYCHSVLVYKNSLIVCLDTRLFPFYMCQIRGKDPQLLCLFIKLT